ncbi:hypothetical protein [Jannaschia marina]|uniref:hypothetical protein n=1 Tax=Jannaschia marina TaxID=2741674 RepID=UPI0015C9E157|nr:hypothetical protein [Jannaschia marina]
MAALQPLPAETRSAPPPAIALLRLAALDCRAAPRQALHACAVLAHEAGPIEHCMMLARALQSASDRRFVLWEPGSEGLSFDEGWLMALLEARTRGDGDSERFLLARRVRPQAWPVLRLLLDGMCDTLR